jgi:hypothetical protein
VDVAVEILQVGHHPVQAAQHMFAGGAHVAGLPVGPLMGRARKWA